MLLTGATETFGRADGVGGITTDGPIPVTHWGARLSLRGHVVYCGADVIKPASGPTPSYCSKKCRGAASRPWSPSGGPANSVATSLNQCDSTAYADRHGRECSEPGCLKGSRARGLCAKHWRRAARAEGREASPEWTQERRARWKAREIRKRTTSDTVYERDEWMCQLCNVCSPTCAQSCVCVGDSASAARSHGCSRYSEKPSNASDAVAGLFH